jgi:hypothetical protein
VLLSFYLFIYSLIKMVVLLHAKQNSQTDNLVAKAYPSSRARFLLFKLN